MNDAAARCRTILEQNIADFFLPGMIDPSGGYYEDERDGAFFDRGEKFVVMQARQLWFCALLCSEGIRRNEALQAAAHGFDHLQRAFRDPYNGGYFASVSRDGPTDTSKRLYFQAFVIFALARYHAESRDHDAISAAMTLFGELDRHARDRARGGYLEYFGAAWQPLGSSTNPARSLNGHLHLFEALAELQRIAPAEEVAARLKELLLLLTTAFSHPRHRSLMEGWTDDWRLAELESNRLTSYGHTLELVWLALAAAPLAGTSETALLPWALRNSGEVFRCGWDKVHGGIALAGPPGGRATDWRKEWWVRAETLPALLRLYRLTGRDCYYAAFEETLSFIERYLLAPGGGWWATVAADGTPLVRTRATKWQCAYHSGRAMAVCARLLDELAAQGGGVAGSGGDRSARTI